MNTETSTTNSVMIEFRGKTYPCNRLERNGQTIYQLVFGKSHLYLTKAIGRNQTTEVQSRIFKHFPK